MSIHATFFRSACLFSIAAATFSVSAHAAESGKPAPVKHTPAERMTLPHLEAAHKDATQYEKARQPVELQTGLHDYRGILHAHAEDSSHTGGTRPEMLACAKKAGVQVIMLTDHFRPPRDFIESSWRGVREGVLFIPGSEAKGYLIYPVKSVMDKMSLEGQEFVTAITANNGLIFLSHIEERPDHSMSGLTGMEICNRHYDAKRDMASVIALANCLTDPAKYAEVQNALKLYPAELLAAQQNYPEVYITKWDAEMQKQRVVGIAADDCHHNQVMIAKMIDENTIGIGTIVDKDDSLHKVSASDRPGVKEMLKGWKPGDIVAKLDIDPYDIFFRDISTHLLARELTEAAVRSTLQAGHAYVSCDWMCDPTGFVYGARKGSGAKLAAMMGDEIPMSGDLRLVAEFPVACDIRVIKNGQVVKDAHERRIDIQPDGPGAYRIEGWLTVDGESRPWIYANPIYVR